MEYRILYIGRQLRPYRINFLKSLESIGSLSVLVESGLECIPNDLKCTRSIYRNNVIRDEEGFNSKWPNIYISFDLINGILITNCNIVILEGTSGSLFIVALVARLRGIKVVISFERTLHTERNAILLKQLYHRVLFNHVSNGILANGRSTVDYLRKVGRRQLIYVRNVFPDNSFKKRVTNRDIDFLFVGQLIERKGVIELIKLMNYTEDNNYILNIVGDGPLREKLESEIPKKKNIQYYRYMDYDSVMKKMRNSKYLFMPTLEDNWSLVTLEAALNGCVPITTEYNGVINDILDETNSLIYDFSDEFWINNHAVISNDQRRRKLSENCMKLNSLRIYSQLERYFNAL